MKAYMDYTLKILEELLNIPSPSGDTGAVTDYVVHLLKELGVKTDITNKNAVIGTIYGRVKDKNKVVSAHVDTLGAMVKEIKSNGRLKLSQIGGYSWSSIEGENCTIVTMDGKRYTGSIHFEKASVHNYGNAPRDEKRTESNMEIRIDEKVNSKKEVEALGINIGDFIHFDPRTIITDNGFIKSRFLDDKACVAIILGTIKSIMDKKLVPKYDIKILISNYEEVGHGASSLPSGAFQILAVDMASPGEGQNSEEDCVTICAKDSSGPYDLNMRKRLVELAQKNDVDYKIDIYNHYGSDASAALRGGNCVQHGLVGPGVDASHSYERTHADGLYNTMKLLEAYILD
jgi:putative aminopeptidase FrvX